MDRSFEVYCGQASLPWTQSLTQRRIDWMCAQARGYVLDVGCSQGIVPWLLAQKGLDVTGVDADADAIAWAKQQLAQCPPAVQEHVTFHCQDFSQFVSQTRFDTIIAGEYLEHLSDADLDVHLRHMRSLLSENGQVIITVPLGLHPHPDHLQTFFPGNLSAILARYFSILTMDVQDAYLRCVCDLATPRQVPAPEEIIRLYEQAILQIQDKELNKSRPQPRQRHSSIESYLKKPSSPKQGHLQDWLAERGFRAPFRYDVDLFRTLNEYYEDKPLVPSPRQINPASLFTQADNRVRALLPMLPSFEGCRCREGGCGRGETSVRLSERGKCDVTGVDITAYKEWDERQGEHVHLLPLDITAEAPFPTESFDFIFSFVVLEHVFAPLDMLTTIYSLLNPGGKLYFTANLYRGPQASHRYREVFFPWPHLLFDDAVFVQYYKDAGYTFNGAPAWVNKLTHLHYLEHVKKLGFTIERCNYTKHSFDQDFYACFNEKLGKYPVTDLELDFIRILLKK